MPGKNRKKPVAKTAVKDTGPRIRTVAENRRARFNYDLLDRFEAGIALTGTEIKSVRAGRATIQDAYAQVRDGEAWLMKMHIAQWVGAGPWNHEPERPRRLLLHRDQIERLNRASGAQGLTVVPLRVYIKGHHAKVELAIGKGRRRYDKRHAIQQRETEREIARAIRHADR